MCNNKEVGRCGNSPDAEITEMTSNLETKNITSDQLTTARGLVESLAAVRGQLRRLRSDRAARLRADDCHPVTLGGQHAVPAHVQLELVDVTPDVGSFGEQFAVLFDGERVQTWDRMQRDNERLAAFLNALLLVESCNARVAYRALSPCEMTSAELARLEQ